MINIQEKCLGITLGDPNGIGPEITAKTLNFLNKKKIPLKFILLGSQEAFLRSCNLAEVDYKLPNIKEFISFNSSLNLNGKASPEGGKISYLAICKAVELFKEKKIDAMVTAPISKESLHLAGYKYDGHTGLLAELFKINNPYLMLANKKFSTLHVTCHIPLKDVSKFITMHKVLETIKTGNIHMQKIGIKNPKIAVCGLNPHSGESGIFGKEELEAIIPAIKKASNLGIDIKGPISGDIIFREARRGSYDLVIANYHDQGHIPVKLLYFENSVNVTLGVPFLRTSVDHGTAFDIALKNKANPQNMLAAIIYALKMLKKD